MKVVDGIEMKKLDRKAMEEYGIPGVILMEHAGMAVTEEILKDLAHQENKEIVIVCGTGNNGGDGVVAARHLHQKGFPVKVRIIGDIARISEDAKINCDILKKLRVDIKTIIDFKDVPKLSEELSRCGVIVDAIFGTGLNKEVQGLTREVILAVNRTNTYVLSIDIPSGVRASDGHICGIAVKADKTVVLQLPKIGNIQFPGADYAGEMVVKDIGIPHEAIEKSNFPINLITADMVQAILPQRRKDTHKGNYGKAYIVAGSTGMTGAAMLTCEAVLRSGAGLLKVAIPQSLNNIMEVRLTEAITVPLPELKKGVVGISDIEKIIKTMQESDVIAVGPGSGQTRELEEVLRNIFEAATIPIVLDADALNALAHRQEILKLIKSAAVLTPHTGEMSRLTNIPVEEINRNRIQIALEFAKKWNVILILKGARTIVASPDGKVFVNTTGNPGMATAGSGDVLTGIVTGLLAQGIQPIKAAIAAVYLHGVAGDRAAARLGEYGLIAGDIVLELPYAIKEIVGK
ncbi:bifunctional ADP-dependent NAD(P)H-hydrate dehydratase/NAD(P)H-hydrate epimerase [Thermotalea metallivorans]|uniref:Bifunctional NAD(P)H-hydrate repair enzyme n=1 Tax=Thermotalea metallivorans TaxID=520762 RepID=A0A140L1N2_9FIRM|nr:bifunctional ADP-dependent NAD(P)H-hydrate dehydratase/NAD(P)H-hydrate epimerase [Thermotalea metallivorans]KXG74457.1 Bifunctional NAD(P)H-hydrate repair enzyme Nnr [Thermotalea metallivorans]